MNQQKIENKLFVILAYRRTGSNYLMKVLDSFLDIEFFGEVYHWDTVWMPINRKLEYVSWLKEKHNIKLNIGQKPGEDRELVDFNHSQPDYFLKFFNETSGSKYAGFKMFPEHLGWSKLKQSVVSNKSITKILLTRNLLDVYISDKILEKTHQSQEYNTSAIKVKIDCLDFKHWYYETQSYYSQIELFLKNDSQKCLKLSYEDIHKHNNNSEKIKYIHFWLEKQGFEVENQQAESEYTKKQDKRSSSLEKIENVDELKGYLRKNHLQHLINT